MILFLFRDEEDFDNSVSHLEYIDANRPVRLIKFIYVLLFLHHVFETSAVNSRIPRTGEMSQS